MRRRLIVASLSIAFSILWAGPAFAYTSPGSPSGYVNDFAHVLKIDTVTRLNTELKAFEASSSNEIAVVTVPSMNGDYIENYAPQLFKEWGIGKKVKDNGVLLLLSIEEHKIRIEVGYGLEGALPDSIAQSIINTDLTPNLKAGNYDMGVTTAVSDIISATKNEYQANTQASKGDPFSLYFYFMGGFVLLIILQVIASILARSKSWWAGGIVGAFFGLGIWAFLGLLVWWGLVVVGALTVLGLLFDYFISKTYTTAKSAGTRIPWWIGGGGGSGGSGSSGGGFGGFGGGSSGGGGASGGW